MDGSPPTVRKRGADHYVAYFSQHLAIRPETDLATMLELADDDAGMNFHPMRKLVNPDFRIERPYAPNE